MMNNETTQLVIIELVIGRPAISKNESAFKCTPSPAADRWWVVRNKAITVANGLKIKLKPYRQS